jgi:hypothetical protein
MKRLMLAVGLAGVAVCPATALASPSKAKVLSVDARHRVVQLVDTSHVVHAYRFRGKLPRLGLGDTVAYRRSGTTISRVKRTARAFGTIAFYAKVVGSGSRQVRLRLGDGRPFSLPSAHVSHRTLAHAATAPASASASAPTVTIAGLAPGETVLISETVDAHGHWTIAITLPSTTTTAGGQGDGTGDDSSDDQVAEGTITQVSDTQLSINTGSQQLSFSADPDDDLTDGFLAGDVVDVTYYRNDDGSLSADDVEYVEQDALGAVSAVSDGSLTLTDQDTGQPDTFTADPEMGLFDGVNLGDQVDVTYHQSAGGDVADAIDDQVWDNN